MGSGKVVTAEALQEIVDNVIARELSKTCIFSPEEIYRSIKVLNRMDLVMTSIKIAEVTQFPLSFCSEMLKVIQDMLKQGNIK